MTSFFCYFRYTSTLPAMPDSPTGLEKLGFSRRRPYRWDRQTARPPVSRGGRRGVWSPCDVAIFHPRRPPAYRTADPGFGPRGPTVYTQVRKERRVAAEESNRPGNSNHYELRHEAIPPFGCTPWRSPDTLFAYRRGRRDQRHGRREPASSSDFPVGYEVRSL